MSELTELDLHTFARAFGFIFQPKDMFDIAEAAEYRLRTGSVPGPYRLTGGAA